MAENHFLVGLSVDGTKETHDACRHDKKGSGTYDVVTKAAALMDAYGVEYKYSYGCDRKNSCRDR